MISNTFFFSNKDGDAWQTTARIWQPCAAIPCTTIPCTGLPCAALPSTTVPSTTVPSTAIRPASDCHHCCSWGSTTHCDGTAGTKKTWILPYPIMCGLLVLQLYLWRNCFHLFKCVSPGILWFNTQSKFQHYCSCLFWINKNVNQETTTVIHTLIDWNIIIANTLKYMYMGVKHIAVSYDLYIGYIIILVVRLSKGRGSVQWKLEHGDVIKWKHFRVTDPLWGESTGHWWIPLTKAIDAEFWCFLWSAPEQRDEQIHETPVIWDAIVLIMTSLQWCIVLGATKCRIEKIMLKTWNNPLIDRGEMQL